MEIDLNELNQLRLDLEEESAVLSGHNNELMALLDEMSDAWRGDTKFPEYKKNLDEIVSINEQTVSELKNLSDGAYQLLVALIKAARQA